MSALKLKPLPLAISLGIFLVYLAVPTRNFYWDGVGFAQAIEDAPNFSPALIHPNHLIYTAMGYLDYRLIHALGFHARSLTVLQVTNSFLSAAVAYLFFEIAAALFRSQYASAVVTLALAFSATWWRFSTDANAYIPSVLLLLAGFRMLLPGRAAKPFLLAAAHTGAMLFHELAVLFLPVAFVGLLLQTSLLPFSRRLRTVVAYSTSAFLFTAGAYYCAFRSLQANSPMTERRSAAPSFLAWAASHSSDSALSWSLARNAFLTLRSHLRLFLGGRPALAYELSPRFTLGMIAVMSVLLLALVAALLRPRAEIKSFRGFGAASSPANLFWIASTWIIPYLLFLFFWLPGNVFYRLFYLPPLLLLLAFFFTGNRAPLSRRPTESYAAVLLVALMAGANFTFDIVPNSRPNSNPPLQFAQRLQQVAAPDALVLFSDFNTDDWTIRYFNPATSWKKWGSADHAGGGKDANDLSVLDEELVRSGGTAWLDTTAFEHVLSLPGGNEWLQAHSKDNSRLEMVNSRVRIVFQRITKPEDHRTDR